MLEPPIRDPKFEALEAAIDELARDRLGGQTAGLGDRRRHIRRSIDRLEAEFADTLSRFAVAQEYLADNALSTVGWLRRECGLSGAAAVQREEIARQLPSLPATWAGFRRGDIGFQNAAVVARTAGSAGIEAIQRVDNILADSATRLRPEQMRIVAAHARHCVDPDGSLSDANANHERWRLHLSQTMDGLFVLDGVLDAEGGACLRTALEALMPPRRDSELTPARRRADALVELARRSLNSGELPTAHGVRPHLTVTAPMATLQRQPGSPGAELAWAGVIPAETARRLACDASVTRISVDAAGNPLDAGRSTRSVPPAIRRALILRDRGCQFVGCDRPADWTDAHHIKHWADGGATKLGNLVLLCRRHHRQVHEGGRPLRRGDDGTVESVPP